MHFSEKRQPMMLAKRIEINVLDHHHLTVILLKESRTQYSLRVFVIPFAQELKCLPNPMRRLQQTFAVRVFPYLTECCFNGFCYRRRHLGIGMKILQIHYCNTCILPRTI
jgi:hypothetical protein